MQSCRRLQLPQRMGMQKNTTPYNNQKNISEDNKKEWACREINDSIQQSTTTARVCSVAEQNQGGKNPFWMAAEGGAEQNRKAVSQ